MSTRFTYRLPLVLLLASLTGLAGCGRKPAVPASAANNALGEVVAEEAARLVGPGGKVMVLAPVASDPAGMTIEPVLKALAATLAQQGKVSVVATHRVKARLTDPSPTREEMTGAQFEGLVRDMKGATGVVSFVGFPVLDEAQIAALKSRQLKCLAVYTAGPQAGPHYKKLLTDKVLGVVLLPRFEAPASTVPNASAARVTVNRQFQLVTPDTVAQATF